MFDVSVYHSLGTMKMLKSFHFVWKLQKVWIKWPEMRMKSYTQNTFKRWPHPFGRVKNWCILGRKLGFPKFLQIKIRFVGLRWPENVRPLFKSKKVSPEKVAIPIAWLEDVSTTVFWEKGPEIEKNSVFRSKFRALCLVVATPCKRSKRPKRSQSALISIMHQLWFSSGFSIQRNEKFVSLNL